MSLRESESTSKRLSKSSDEQLFGESRFGTVVRALWPHKPALNLAQRMGVSERNALQIIRGERGVSARALIAVITEIS
jgi:hypothetical protein